MKFPMKALDLVDFYEKKITSLSNSSSLTKLKNTSTPNVTPRTITNNRNNSSSSGSNSSCNNSFIYPIQIIESTKIMNDNKSTLNTQRTSQTSRTGRSSRTSSTFKDKNINNYNRQPSDESHLRMNIHHHISGNGDNKKIELEKYSKINNLNYISSKVDHNQSYHHQDNKKSIINDGDNNNNPIINDNNQTANIMYRFDRDTINSIKSKSSDKKSSKKVDEIEKRSQQQADYSSDLDRFDGNLTIFKLINE
jgi:hypothetical protein